MKKYNIQNPISRILISLLIMLLLYPPALSAAMRSSSYVLYENVMHSFDGPVITGVSHSVSGVEATVVWNTDVAADSFVIYGIDPAFVSSQEQGTSHKGFTSHSVTLTGLEDNTTYHYRVRSERVNGGISVDVGPRSFTTGSSVLPGEESTPPPSGGGMLIIDKTDKIAPLIENVEVVKEEDASIEIRWTTDEPATSFVEYGRTVNYGMTYGSWATSTEHSVRLLNLTDGALYYFRVISSDGWGNVGMSEGMTFSTTEGDEIGEEIDPEEDELALEPGIVDTDITEAVTARILEFIQRLFPAVSLNELVPGGLLDIESLEQLAGFVPAPVLSGEPRIEAGATQATFFWTTDVEASSLIAIAPESVYDPAAAEPYQQIVGDPEGRTINHQVTVYGLEPGTIYHFQLRSGGDIGPMARSRDFTFSTSLEELAISNAFYNIEDDTTAVFRWITNKDADSAVRFTPYRGNVLAVDLSKTIRNNEQSIIHEIRISEFEPAVFYQVELLSADTAGNTANDIFDQFATAEDDLPPVITHIKADSTIFVDRGNKIQTIISWVTNEPATSRIYFQEGVHGPGVELSDSTDLNTNYTREHVMVITRFNPGVVYTFRVESIDSGNNVTLSPPHTFMTAKTKESIIQIIINILENTFGWVKKLM